MLKNPIVNIPELRRIVNDLLEYVEAVHGREFRLEDDYYWDLNSNELYDVKEKIELSAIGSLGDDWEFLLNMTKDHKGRRPLLHARACWPTAPLHWRKSRSIIKLSSKE